LVKHKILRAAKVQNYFGGCNGGFEFFRFERFKRFKKFEDLRDLKDLKI